MVDHAPAGRVGREPVDQWLAGTISEARRAHTAARPYRGPSPEASPDGLYGHRRGGVPLTCVVPVGVRLAGRADLPRSSRCAYLCPIAR
ncbi:MAG: hypothetical protein AVDCRST_MAG32-2616 [uncultured Nocardioides sp.]|uniref:Uncharacterized protein n=1 Tax=uncultured Nocardioides sp. TaxID=198441 RepID=A0A6J4NZ25_9ACTN|nr:MAG: hypothetical protein AVDCRST_MAG32-2616 [uncultured Nocardioides sp.]